MKDNVVANFIVTGLTAVGFILLLKFTTSYLPDNGLPGSIKTAVNAI